MLAAARDQAALLISQGRTRAEVLRSQAQQEFDATGGRHLRRRAALQRQVEDLESFDRECRQQITGIVQRQLRALWAQRPPASEGQGRSAPLRGCRPRRSYGR